MSDPIADLFKNVDPEPDPRFVDALRRRALDELRGTEVEHVEPAARAEPSTVGVVETPSTSGRARGRSVRRWMAALVAAAVLALVVGVAVVVGRTGGTRRPTNGQDQTGVGFTAKLAGDLSLGNGATVRFDADVALSQALESNEIGVDTAKDVLLNPHVTLKLTTNDAQLDLTSAYVNIFLDRTVATCIVNTDGCDDALVRGSVDSTDGIRLATGKPVTIADTSLPSRIRVPFDAAGAVIGRFTSGTAVTGVAVVISTGDETASAIFDSAGQRVLDCPAVPQQCMDPDRSVLFGETASSATAPDAGISEFPPGNVPPGTYTARAVTVPYSITTAGSWELLASNPWTIFLGRTTPFPAELLVRQDIPGIETAADAIDHFCPAGAVDFGATTTTTLLGATAVQAEGAVLTDCSPEVITPAITGNPYRRLTAAQGATIRITAADIDGGVVVVVAVAATADWPAFRAELEATTLQRL